MATTVIDVPVGAWTLILPTSGTGYAVVNAPFGIKFKQAASAPAVGDPNCSEARYGDVIASSPALDIYATASGATAGKVTRHD